MGVGEFLDYLGNETIGLKTLFFLALGGCLIYVQYFKREKRPKQNATIIVPERKLKKKFLAVDDRFDEHETHIRRLYIHLGLTPPPRFGSHDHIHHDDDSSL